MYGWHFLFRSDVNMNEHNHPHSKQIINIKARIIDHAEAVKGMLEEGKECSEILILKS